MGIRVRDQGEMDRDQMNRDQTDRGQGEMDRDQGEMDRDQGEGCVELERSSQVGLPPIFTRGRFRGILGGGSFPVLSFDRHHWLCRCRGNHGSYGTFGLLLAPRLGAGLYGRSLFCWRWGCQLLLL